MGVAAAEYFEVSCNRGVNRLSTVRRFVSDFYLRVLRDPDTTSQLAVATHELLDNALTYSSDGNATFRVGVQADPGIVHVVLTTENRATNDHIEAARRALDKLTRAGDPAAYFLELMNEAARRPEGSGLGLARVRAESDMSIRYEVHGDCLELEATADFKRGEAT
jgi:hypothetical protein